MIRGTTSSGFAYRIEDSALDDYELLELMTEIDAGSTGNIPKMVEMLLGKEQKEALKSHCKVDGRVSSAKMVAEITEILLSHGEGKN